MLTVRDVTHAKDWCSHFLALIRKLSTLSGGEVYKIGGYTSRDFLIKVVEANPVLELPWGGLGDLLTHKGETIVIDESNFTSSVAIDVSSSAAWEDLDNVLAEGARIFEKAAITALGRPYSQKDCFAKVVELNPQSEDGWVALFSCMVTMESVSVDGNLLTTVQCLVKLLAINPLHS